MGSDGWVGRRATAISLPHGAIRHHKLGPGARYRPGPARLGCCPDLPSARHRFGVTPGVADWRNEPLDADARVAWCVLREMLLELEQSGRTPNPED